MNELLIHLWALGVAKLTKTRPRLRDTFLAHAVFLVLDFLDFDHVWILNARGATEELGSYLWREDIVTDHLTLSMGFVDLRMTRLSEPVLDVFELEIQNYLNR